MEQPFNSGSFFLLVSFFPIIRSFLCREQKHVFQMLRVLEFSGGPESTDMSGMRLWRRAGEGQMTGDHLVDDGSSAVVFKL